MHFKRIIFLLAAAFAALAGTQVHAVIYRADTLTRNLGGGKQQHIHFFSTVKRPSDGQSAQIHNALAQLPLDTSIIITTAASRAHSVGVSEEKIKLVNITTRAFFDRLDSLNQHDLWQQMNETTVSGFKQALNFALLSGYNDDPELNKWNGSFLDVQQEFYKASFNNLPDNTNVTTVQNFSRNFNVAGSDISFMQLSSEYADERLAIELMHAIYTATDKNNRPAEHIIVCAEGRVLVKVIEQIKKLEQRRYEFAAFLGNQTTEAVMGFERTRQFNKVTSINIGAYVREYQSNLSRRADDQRVKSIKPANTYLRPLLFALGIGAVALTYYYRDAFSSLLGSIWSSIFGSSQKSFPASAPQRLA